MLDNIAIIYALPSAYDGKKVIREATRLRRIMLCRPSTMLYRCLKTY